MCGVGHEAWWSLMQWPSSELSLKLVQRAYQVEFLHRTRSIVEQGRILQRTIMFETRPVCSKVRLVNA
jgi:hypothetical protein